MVTLEEAGRIASLILAAWGILALVVGPIAIMRARKYFPERKEAVTPDQLREQLNAALENTDFKLRESFNNSIGRLQTTFEMQHARVLEDLAELKDDSRSAHRRASEAKEAASASDHKAELVSERVNGLERVMLAKLDHFETLLRQGRARDVT